MEPLAAGDPQQAGPYRLRARLGAGGMGQVFLGYSPAGRAVAVKLIHRELARDPEFRTRFRREVAAARAVSGAYTAPVTAAGPDDDPPWLATEGPPASGIAVADGIVYAGGNDYVVHALRTGNGRPVWAFTADGPVESQIAAAGRVAFVGSNGGQVYALTR